MPFTDPEKRRAYHRKYQRAWARKRRQQFMRDKQCLYCGRSRKLHLHHRDPSTKIHHRIWTWRQERREQEIEKCDVLCPSCHILADWRVRHPDAPAHFGPGVSYWRTQNGKKRWRAELRHGGKRFCLGTWDTEEEAHMACNHKRAEWAAVVGSKGEIK